MSEKIEFFVIEDYKKFGQHKSWKQKLLFTFIIISAYAFLFYKKPDTVFPTLFAFTIIVSVHLLVGYFVKIRQPIYTLEIEKGILSIFYGDELHWKEKLNKITDIKIQKPISFLKLILKNSSILFVTKDRKYKLEMYPYTKFKEFPLPEVVEQIKTIIKEQE